jgi:hypothetical protein
MPALASDPLSPLRRVMAVVSVNRDDHALLTDIR